MSSPRLSLALSGGAAYPNLLRLLLEQEPVSTGALSLADLGAMLSLVRSGISARAYLAKSCPASLLDGLVRVPLTLYVWPSHRQEYTLGRAITEWTGIGEPVAIEQERDFDLVVENADTVDLPCLAADLAVTWQSPAIRINGAEIDPPPISGYDLDQGCLVDLDMPHGPVNRLKLETACFGVLRIRCRAMGYRHAITLSIPKDSATSISDVKETITAAWQLADGSTATTTLALQLPPCVATLMAACDDGSQVADHLGSVEKKKYRKLLRYTTCTGAVLDYREIEVDQ